MHWKLKVTGYGKIEAAEIESAPLTLFVGDNNSGKSYLMSLLWGIQNLGTMGLMGGGTRQKTNAERELVDWVRTHIESVRTQGSSTAQAAEVGDALQLALGERLAQNKENVVRYIFNSRDVKLNSMEIMLKDLEHISITFQRLTGKDGQWTDDISFKSSIGVEYTVSKIIWERIDHTDENVMVCVMLSLVTGIPFGNGDRMNQRICLPSARTGFMLTKDIINKVGRNTAFNLWTEQEQGFTTPFVRPVNQFLDVISDLTFDGRGVERLRGIRDYWERGMAEGTVEISGLPNKEVSYVPSGLEIPMPLRVASAVVTELAPLILILKHKDSLKALFYEEPEMCLHPQLQQKMARVICQLVNGQVDMTVTTHSDIILQHMNNMISLSERENREELCRRLGYGSDDLLRREQIKVYQLSSRAKGCTEVEELICGEHGFAVWTFNNALDRIMDEAYVIQE